jgi:WD40 repeat protein
LLAAPGAASAQPKVVATLKEGTSSVTRLTFTPDGKTLASVSVGAGVVRLWDVGARKESGVLRCPAGVSWLMLSFSADGKTLATASRRGNRRPGQRGLYATEVWDVPARKVRRSIEHPEGRGAWGVLTPDGKTLVVTDPDASAAVYDAATGKEVAVLRGQPDSWSVAVSRDGRWLATGSSDGSVYLWDLPGRKLLHKLLRGHGEQVVFLDFSPDGGALVSGDYGTRAIVWERAKGTERARLNLLPQRRLGACNGLAFTPDGKKVVLAGQGLGNGIVAWDPATGRLDADPTARLRGPISDHLCMALSPDGRTLATGGSKVILLWDLDPPKPAPKPKPPSPEPDK